MIEVFKEYIQRTINLTEDEWELIRSKIRLDVISKRQCLLREGQHWKSYAFIVKGCVKTFKYTNTDIETNISFNCENSRVGDRERLITGNPPRFNMESLEETHVVIFNSNDFDSITYEIRSFSDFQKTISVFTTALWSLAISSIFVGSLALGIASLAAGRITERVLPNLQKRIWSYMTTAVIASIPDAILRIPDNFIGRFSRIRFCSISVDGGTELRHR